jgi:hypothetical protein
VSRAPGLEAKEVRVEDSTKVLVDLLSNELVRVKAKGVATDDWFYRLLSVGIVPFLAFLGYCAVNQPYRILIAALPSLSITGALIVGILSNHYQYARYYGDYLERRINDLLGGEVLLDSRFVATFYRGWFSLVSLGYAVSLALLLLLNVAAYPVIDATVQVFYTGHHKILGWSAWLLKYFWQLTLLYGCMVIGIYVVSYIRSERHARQLLKQFTGRE